MVWIMVVGQTQDQIMERLVPRVTGFALKFTVND